MISYENLLASRYIKAQKRQSVFTTVSITAAVAVITMIFVLYSVCMNCLENVCFSSAPFHLLFSELTEEQARALADFAEVRSVNLEAKPDGISAYVLFSSDIGDRELWLQKAAQKIGAPEKYERSKNSSMHGSYEWNDNLMKLDGVYDGAHLVKLRIFCIFFIFAILIAFALRLIIDTAFEVSSKERERHYGVLQSIGATPEQIVRIITLEGLRLCGIGIPLALIAGTGLAYLMFNVLLRAGIAELFPQVSIFDLNLLFTVDWKMLLIAAAVGVVWVFLSAYGVGMRVIKKTPMEAITTRADTVEKVKKRTLSGLLFGISGSIASRNARRQKKRFAITVLTLTVSITLFSLFSSLTETIERSITNFLPTVGLGLTEEEAANVDFIMPIGNYQKGISYTDAAEELAASGLFEHIALSLPQTVGLHTEDDKEQILVCYVNREAYTQYFGADAQISYDDLCSSGGYVYNLSCNDAGKYAEKLQSGSVTLTSFFMKLPEDADIENMSHKEIIQTCTQEKKDHTVEIIGTVSLEKNKHFESAGHFLLIGALETYETIAPEWYGVQYMNHDASFALVKTGTGEYRYNAADMKKAQDWFMEHSDFVNTVEGSMINLYELKWKTHSIMAAFRAGMLVLNLLIALAALINLLNIISTGIANRRSELASLQCVGMTDKQLDRMAVIECLQFTGAAAIISAVICAVVVFGAQFVLTALINASFVDEGEETRKMLINMIHIDHITPFIRIMLSALTAFAAGCVTSLVMLRAQNTDSLSEQIRGTEMQLDTRKSHLLRNTLIAAAGAAVLVIGGLRIYSVTAYHIDRREYEKAGYLNLVDGADKKINVYSTGAQNGKHTIVGIAGMGVNCFPIITKELNARLGKENTLVYPDRAGYGFSDDTCKTQTLEQVVEDYRTGLKNAGFTAPYVLMVHSYGSYYALWWQAKYPDEVEAIVFLDGTWLMKDDFWMMYTEEEHPEGEAAAQARKLKLRTWLGLDRLFPSPNGDGSYGRSLFNDEEIALWKRCENRTYTAANLSETLNEADAAHDLRAVLQPTDTPKLYFSTMYTSEEQIRENYESTNADMRAAGLTPKRDPATAAKAEWQRDSWMYQDIYDNILKPFLEQCGNCRLISIGSEHGLFYARKPDEVADAILSFLAETTE